MFTPPARASYSSSLAVTSNGGSATITLQGQGVGPVYASNSAPGSTLDFRKVMQGDTNDLCLTDAARQRLAEEGYDPVYGARPLRRVIQHRIENPLALRILEGTYAQGHTIAIDADGEGFAFQ